jgi:hypothetical protein
MMNAPHHFEKLAATFHQNRPVSPPKQLTIMPVRAIESLHVDAVDVPHAARKAVIQRLNQQVMMVCSWCYQTSVFYKKASSRPAPLWYFPRF